MYTLHSPRTGKGPTTDNYIYMCEVDNLHTNILYTSATCPLQVCVYMHGDVEGLVIMSNYIPGVSTRL